MIGNEAAPARVPDVLAEAEGAVLPPGSSRPVPRWVTPIFAALALVLVGYVFILGLTLPTSATARHWNLAWEGFDVGLVAALGASAYLAWRRNPYVTSATSVAAAFLVIDAWFDTITSKRGWEQVQSFTLALLVELPLACICLYLARHGEHNQARAIERLAEAAGPEDSSL